MSQSDGTQTCPYCAETIKAAAIKCRYCQSDLRVLPTSFPSAQPAMSLTALPKQPEAVSKAFRVELMRTRPTPVAGPVSFFTVTGRISNVSNERRSFHISVLGRHEVDGKVYNTGMMGQTETPSLAPGEESEWEAKIAIKDENYPTSLRYLVASQERPGQLPVNRLTVLENPSQLGTMLHVMMGQVAAAIAQWDEPVPEEEPVGSNIDKAVRQQPVAPAESVRTWPHMASAVPLHEWKGMGKMTRRSTLPCYCRSCGHDWQLDAAVGNSIAQEHGLAGRLQRAGTGMEQFGATFTPFASGRRIAAGNERQRQEEHLRNLRMLAACPRCRSIDVLLAG